MVNNEYSFGLLFFVERVKKAAKVDKLIKIVRQYLEHLQEVFVSFVKCNFLAMLFARAPREGSNDGLRVKRKV